MVRNILVMRRNPEDMSEAERYAFEKAFPGEELVFHRSDAANFIEHDNHCAEVGATIVVLPCDRPIPALAMDRDVPHVRVDQDGDIMELVELKPIFKFFTPKG